MAILDEVASRFGYQLSKATAKTLQFADGGVNSSSASSGANVQIIQNFPQVEKDSVALTRAGQLLAARGE